MHISDLLSPGNTFADVHAADKASLLKELSHRAAWKAGIEGEVVTGEILKREEVGSTGIGGGVAIPHARLPRLQKPFGLFARLDRAIDFDAVDDQPVDLVFLLLLPDDPEGQQLNALACVARELRDAEALERIRGAHGDELYRAIITSEGKEE